MTIGTTTALNIIQGTLRKISSYQSGEAIDAPDANDCLEVLNDLLDSLSTSKEFVFGSQENILSWTAGQRLYKIGNPVCTLLGSLPFTGTLTAGSNVITGVTVPSNLVAGVAAAYAIGSGSILTDTQGLIPANTTVTAFNAIAGTVTMSAAPVNLTGTALSSVTYTVPGDFPIARPLRITHGFTRFNALDFTFNVYASESEYTEILYKAQPGPWPTIGWYNNAFPYGLLNVYQVPGNNGELHLFTDTILGNLTLNQVLVMPQGYSRAIKWLLAREIWTEYWGAVPVPPAIKELADEASRLIKALNARPAVVSKYDSELSRGNRPDGGWIFRGGY